MKKAIFLFIIGAFLYSCAKDESTVKLDSWTESFDAWVAKNDPGAEKKGNIYIRYIERGVNPQPHTLVENQSWVLVNYIGYTLNGDVFINRSDSMARLLGSTVWSSFVHYSDDFTYYNNNHSNSICSAGGFREALQNMKIGDSVRVYIPMHQAYHNHIDISTGYKGETNNYVNFPVAFDIRLKAITNSPLRFEMDSLAKFARIYWGQDPKDTIQYGVYMRKIKENPNGSQLTEDSSAIIRYTHSFLDGFVIATNIDSVAVEHGIYKEDQTARYDPYSFNLDGSGVNINYPQALTIACRNMRRGEIAEVAVLSYNSVGMAGTQTTTDYVVEVPAYSSAIFWVKIKDEGEEDF